MQKVFKLILICLFVPLIAWGEKQQSTSPLNFRESNDVNELDSYGYKWEKDSKTLTLDGFNMYLIPQESNNRAI